MSKKVYKVVAKPEYVLGEAKNILFYIELSEDEYRDFKEMKVEEKTSFLTQFGQPSVGAYEVHRVIGKMDIVNVIEGEIEE